MSKHSAWNIKYWVEDPNTQLASGRKLNALMWVALAPVIAMAVIAGAIDSKTLLILLSVGTGNAGIYGLTSPSKKKPDAGN